MDSLSTFCRHQWHMIQSRADELQPLWEVEPEAGRKALIGSERGIAMEMVVLVMDDMEKVARVLEAWRETGVSGITIWDSRGLGRTLHYRRLLDDVPLMPSLDWLLRPREDDHTTLFTLVDREEMVDCLIDVTEAITGSLDGEDRGILFVLPVSRAVGVRGTRQREAGAQECTLLPVHG